MKAMLVFAGLAMASLGQATPLEETTPGEVGMDPVKLMAAREHALTGGGSGIIMRGGKVVLRWGDQKQRYDLKSSTKSIGITALGLAIGDGKLGLDDLATDRHPQFGTPPDANAETGWLGTITLRHLATQTAGFEKPGGYEPLVSEPGTKWSYSDGGPNWLAECVTLAYGRDLDELMFERVFGPIGITRDDLMWRNNAYRDHEIEGIKRREFGSGIHANVEAMARVGMLYLRGGEWDGEQIIPRSFVDACRTTVDGVVGLPEQDPDTYGNASDHYGLLWWNNADGTLADAPRDAYWSWGLYESLIVVIPSLDVVAARAGKSWQRDGWGGHYGVLEPFIGAIAQSVAAENAAPYPMSQVIVGMTWAPESEIIRLAEGSDNWPMTWGDDDAQYAAYGDGWGFVPKTEAKLSLGLARVTGTPPDIEGVNVRSKTGEQIGDGKQGKKASGMLMVEGTLYMWVRNAANSQLAWSEDQGQTWTWADWRFTESFGAPTFLNFGPNYAGARDGHVYVYSFDSDSAYEPADRYVLARVPKRKLRDRAAYEFFVRLDGDGPAWSRDIGDRGAVFEHEGECYRSGITYSAGMKRYLWCQTIQKEDARFEGGLGIYDAPEPWGPWTTVYFADTWDVGPGESSNLPTKWMSEDGLTVHLAFSGDDFFSVRRARFGAAQER